MKFKLKVQVSIGKMRAKIQKEKADTADFEIVLKAFSFENLYQYKA